MRQIEGNGIGRGRRGLLQISDRTDAKCLLELQDFFFLFVPDL